MYRMTKYDFRTSSVFRIKTINIPDSKKHNEPAKFNLNIKSKLKWHKIKIDIYNSCIHCAFPIILTQIMPLGLQEICKLASGGGQGTGCPSPSNPSPALC